MMRIRISCATDLIVEVEEGVYDFASGVLKSWWRKYHA